MYKDTKPSPTCALLRDDHSFLDTIPSSSRPEKRCYKVVLQFSVFILFMMIQTVLARAECELYPIALHAGDLQGVAAGTELSDILNGTQPGNFGWLTWAGSPSAPALVNSLTSPGDSHAYVNSYDLNDHELSIGDWVQGKPGVSNSKKVRDALNALKLFDITVPVWDETRGQGNNTEYRISGFAVVRILDYRLPGQSHISARFIDHVVCGAVNQPPTVDAGPDKSALLTDVVSLEGSILDDGLPNGTLLTAIWSQESGPGIATFSKPSSVSTHVVFDEPGSYVLRLTGSDTEFFVHAECIIAVSQPNYPPLGTTSPVVTQEDVSVDFELNGTDPDGDVITFAVVEPPVHGTLEGEAPSLRYTPFADYSGPDRIVYEVSDGELTSGAVELAITTLPINDPPLADTQSIGTTEDAATTVTLSGSDIEGARLTYELVEFPNFGILSGTLPELVYVPDANFFGSDTFSFRVSDGELQSSVATVVVLVGEINDPPSAHSEELQLNEDIPLTVVLTGSDVEGSTLAFTVVTPPSHGTLNGTPPELTYTPAFNYHGDDSFEFKVDDGELDSETAEISFEIAPVNDSPIATGGRLETEEDMSLPVTLSGVDVDGDDLQFEVVDPPGHGSLSGSGTEWRYVPAPDHFGEDAFTFVANDGLAVSELATVIISVKPVNDPPVSSSDQVIAEEDTPVALLLGASDVDGDILDYQVVLEPLHGELSGELPHLIYTPELNYHGGDKVVFLASDEEAASEPAAVRITVNPVNDPPLANPVEQTVEEDSPLSIILTGADVDQDELVFEIVLPPTHGVLTGEAPSVTYTPSEDFHGTDEFTFRTSDGELDSEVALASITILPVNDAPTVAIVAPGNNETFNLGRTIAVRIEAEDDNALDRIRVRSNGVLLGELLNAPYEFSWLNPLEGEHTINATAIDDEGSETESAPVSIVVVAGETGDFAVDAGADQIVVWPGDVRLEGGVVESAAAVGEVLAAAWMTVAGNGMVQFANAHSLETKVTFSEPGNYELRLAVRRDDGYRTDTVHVTVLPSVSERLTAARSQRGTDFWFTLLDNHPLSLEPNYYGSYLLIQSEVDTEVAVYDRQYNETRSVSVDAGTVETIALSQNQSDDGLSRSDEVLQNGIHVQADAPITIWMVHYLDESSEGTLLLPSVLLDREYVVMSYSNSLSVSEPGEIVEGSQFAVVATEDDTMVSIVPSQTVGARTLGESYSVALQQGETYRLIDVENITGDLSGTMISANKPVAVFGGHTCANVPSGVAACNHLVEQLPPVDTWGRRFLTFPMAGRTGGDRFRILASENATLVSVGEETQYLQRGGFVEILLAEPIEILASRPVLVAHFANGGTFDDTIGDPAMTLVPPVEHFGGHHRFSTPPSVWHNYSGTESDVFSSYANVVLRSTGMNSLLIDGEPPDPNGVQPIGTSGYVGMQVPIESGVHEITADVPVGVWVYGWGASDAFGYPGGLYSDTVREGVHFELTQKTGWAPVGGVKTVTALILDDLGRPAADYEMEFTVTGANPGLYRVTSNPLGIAALNHLGLEVGVDQITARLAGLEERLEFTWTETSDNHPPQVDAGADRAVFLTDGTTLNPTVVEDGFPLGSELSVRWRTLDGPAEARFGNPESAVTTVEFDLPGRYELELSANDSQFSGESTVVVQVVPPFDAWLTGLTSGSWLAQDASVTLNVTVSDLEGEPSDIEFYDGDTKLEGGFDGQITLTDLGPGQHSISAVVVERHGYRFRTESLVFSVSAAPIIQVNEPIEDRGVVFGASETVFRATAIDPDGEIARLAVYIGPNLIHEVEGDQLVFTGPADGGPPHYWKYRNAQPVRFVAEDDHGIVSEVVPAYFTLLPPEISTVLRYPEVDDILRAEHPIFLQAETQLPSSVQITQVIFERWEEGIFWWESGWRRLGQSTELPFHVQWTPAAIGEYRVRALVQTDLLVDAYTPERTLTVLPPIGLEIASPTADAPLYVGVPTTVELSIDDPQGIYSHTLVYANGGLLGQISGNVLDWTPDQAGSHVLEVWAFDQNGRYYYAEPKVTVQVLEPPVPTIVFDTPAIGEELDVGRLTFVVGEVMDPAGVVTNVILRLDGEVVRSASVAAFDWTPENPGTYTLDMIALDRLGRQAVSEPIQVTASPGIHLGISQPREDELVALGEEYEVNVSMSDPGNVMDRLDLLVNGERVAGSDNVHLSWIPTMAGQQMLRVVATDIFGGSHASVDLPVTVAQLIRPDVSIFSPISESTFIVRQPIQIAIQSSDIDGAVTEIDLRSNGIRILQTNTPSFTFSWADAAPGWHELVAHALDDSGQSATSDSVRFWVEREIVTGVASPPNLRAASRGAGRTLLTWDPVSADDLTGYVILRLEGADGDWREVRVVGPEINRLEQSGLSSETEYTYRVRALIGTNDKAGAFGEVIVQTRTVFPKYGILDLTELVIGDAADSSALSAPQGKRSKFSKAVIGGGALPGGNYNGFAGSESFSPSDRGPFRVSGISDAHEILLAHENGDFTLWSPSGARDLSIPGFRPIKVSRIGVVVGEIGVETVRSDGATAVEFRAAQWDPLNGLREIGGDPRQYREPLIHAPLSQDYEAFHTATDVNVHGGVVGQAAYVYFLNNIGNNDSDPHFIGNHATFWSGGGRVNLGGVGDLNGFSFGSAINDQGTIVGWGAITEIGPDGQALSVQTHAARSNGRHWSESNGMEDLGTLGGNYSAARDINNYGLTVGYSTVSPDDPISRAQAVLWLPSENQPTALPNLGGAIVEYPDGYGHAVAVNDSDIVVGQSLRPDEQFVAALWKRTSQPTVEGTDSGTWEIEDLNVLSDDEVWVLTEAVDINSHGLIVGHGLKWLPDPQNPLDYRWQQRTFMLVPGALLTDANRDGVIDTRPGPESEDRNRVSRRNPWNFWINDDSDSADAQSTSSFDVPGSKHIIVPPYGGDFGVISGSRDLVDYFPVHLDIGALLALFPAPEFEYYLEQRDAAVRFTETDLLPENAGAYLTDVTAAEMLVNKRVGTVDSPFSAAAMQAGRLSDEFLTRISEEGKGVVLVEGRKASQNPIRLQLRRNNKVLLSLFLGLSLSGVEDMYRHRNLLASAGGSGGRPDRLDEPSNYPDDPKVNKNFVFLHGYNVDSSGARGWQAEMFKRLFWSGSRARFYGVTWHGTESKIYHPDPSVPSGSSGPTPDYHANVENAFQTSLDLAIFLRQLKHRGETTIAAHSLGNMVVGAAIQDWNPRLVNYFMIDAAVPLEAYDASESRSKMSPNHNMVHKDWDNPFGVYKESLRASEWYALFPEGDYRRGLTWRGRFDQVPAVRVWNYYSSGEEVLEMHPQEKHSDVPIKLGQNVLSGIFTSDETGLELSRFSWVFQEKNKGRGLTLPFGLDLVRAGSSAIGGWGFNEMDYSVASGVVLPPSLANEINLLTLKTIPFFNKGGEFALYGAQGSQYAHENRDRLLAEMIPARSLPAGANVSERLRDRFNFDMNNLFKNGWPQSRSSLVKTGWRHSDLTDVAFVHTWQVYQSFVNNAGLNNE